MTGQSEDALAGLQPQVQQEISRFIAKLRRRQIGSAQDHEAARKTLEIMRLTIATAWSKDISELIKLLKQAGAAIVAASPHELTIGNMVRRVLQIVREETAGEGSMGGVSAPSATAERSHSAEGGAGGASTGGSGPSLMKLLDAPDTTDYNLKPVKNIKSSIIEAVTELMDELSHVCSHIAEQAIEHIHANEVILTHGRDPAVEAFLKAAGKKRAIEVIVAETALSGAGREMAVALAEAGISTTLIADAAVSRGLVFSETARSLVITSPLPLPTARFSR